MNVYNYCTKCGAELTHDEAAAYHRAESDIPPLCGSCVEQMVQQIGQVADVLTEFTRAALREAFEALSEAHDVQRE